MAKQHNQLTFACSHVVFELGTVDALYGQGYAKVEDSAFIDSKAAAPVATEVHTLYSKG